ncbi:nucleoside monophosphate kinase [bacterium]|nr:nucleoside monophosphate kinase [bacterium]
MNSISSHIAARPVCQGNPWGAVAPRAQVDEKEFKLVPDTVQVSKPASSASARPETPAHWDRMGEQSALAAAAASTAAPMMVLLLGSHDSSKKGQAETIAKNLGLVHLHMGDLIKQEVGAGSELGVNLKKALDGGDDSPALLLYDLVAKRVSQSDVQEHGFILDAYPEDLKHHKAETLLQELEGLRLIELSSADEDCSPFNPVVEMARQRGSYYQVDDEDNQQDTADVLEALVDNFHSTPVRMLAVE